MRKALVGFAGVAVAVLAAPSASAQQTIKIGVILAYSGQFADPSAQMDNGIKLYMNVVFRFANRIIVMVGGRILTQGTPKEIAADARVREVYLGRAHHG